jgi:hypothetical protein
LQALVAGAKRLVIGVRRFARLYMRNRILSSLNRVVERKEHGLENSKRYTTGTNEESGK